MQTIRFNPFGQIHKGLRALLYDTALLIQHTDFTHTAETEAVIERVQLVTSMFGHHAHIEDSQFFPLITAYAPELVDEFESQHVKDHELSEKLVKCVDAFNAGNTPVQNVLAGQELLQNFNAFLAFNVEHMKQEETLVNSCLWRYYSDEELMAKVREVSAAIPPEENRHFVYWMLKGMATFEIIGWFKAIEASAPPPIFRFFCELAELALPARKWEAVQEKLTGEPVMA